MKNENHTIEEFDKIKEKTEKLKAYMRIYIYGFMILSGTIIIMQGGEVGIVLLGLFIFSRMLKYIFNTEMTFLLRWKMSVLEVAKYLIPLLIILKLIELFLPKLFTIFMYTV